MKLIGERYGVAESVDDSRKTALDLMAANPNLTGFLALAARARSVLAARSRSAARSAPSCAWGRSRLGRAVIW